MKWIFSFLLLISLTIRSQDLIHGDWYHVSTGRLFQINISGDSICWNDKTFQFQDIEGEKNITSIITVFRKKTITGIVYKNNDTSDLLPYALTVLQQDKDLRFLDLLMGCGDGSFKDTANMYNYFAACDFADKMIMRFYSKAMIDSFMTLKPVAGIAKNNQVRIKGSFKKKVELLVKEFGEDKLLWVAPVIFGQALTDLLLENGYNPMITQEQAEKLFEFHFF